MPRGAGWTLAHQCPWSLSQDDHIDKSCLAAVPMETFITGKVLMKWRLRMRAKSVWLTGPWLSLSCGSSFCPSLHCHPLPIFNHLTDSCGQTRGHMFLVCQSSSECIWKNQKSQIRLFWLLLSEKRRPCFTCGSCLNHLCQYSNYSSKMLRPHGDLHQWSGNSSPSYFDFYTLERNPKHPFIFSLSLSSLPELLANRIIKMFSLCLSPR